MLRQCEHCVLRWRRACLAAVLGALLITLAVPAFADPSDFGLTFEPATLGSRANPTLPDLATFPIQLVLDDDSAESVYGIGGATARQFLWFNHFANPGPFTLEEIWVLFPSGPDVPLDGDVQLAIYLDPDGDPLTGAQLLATFDVMIQAVTGDDFSVYPLAPPVEIDGSGDVLIGVVNRYFLPTDPPPTFPAALDTTASQDRSYFALWTGDSPPLPDLGTAIQIDVLDGIISGNFMIRGFGSSTAIPTLGGVGLALLVVLLGVAGFVLARRSGLSRADCHSRPALKRTAPTTSTAT